MCISQTMNSIVLFGGTNSQLNFNDLWVFSLDRLVWSEIYPTTPEKPSNVYTGERSYLGGFVSKTTGNLYIFGGNTVLGPQGDFWEFSFMNYKWIEMNTKNAPSVRAGFAYTSFIKDNIEYFAVFGGLLLYMEDNNLIL